MADTAVEQYLNLMSVVRGRFDFIRRTALISGSGFGKAEICAFHGRKIVEGIAFGCLVALEKGIKQVPSDAKGQWNANTIFRRIRSKGLMAFPDPSIIRGPSESESKDHSGIKATIEGQPNLRISVDELIHLYDRLHRWLHEINPYVEKGRLEFLKKYEDPLWRDIERLEKFIDRHTISISGEMMFCVMRDKVDDKTKVIPLSKIASLYSR